MVKPLQRTICGSLRAGTITVGALSLIGALLYVAREIVLSSLLDSRLGGKKAATEEEVITVILVIIGGTVDVVLAVILITGAVKRSGRLVYPWIAVHVFLCVLTFIFVLALGITTLIDGEIAAGVATLCYLFSATLIQSYLILIVYSFYKTLDLESPLPLPPDNIENVENPPEML